VSIDVHSGAIGSIKKPQRVAELTQHATAFLVKRQTFV